MFLIIFAFLSLSFFLFSLFFFFFFLFFLFLTTVQIRDVNVFCELRNIRDLNSTILFDNLNYNCYLVVCVEVWTLDFKRRQRLERLSQTVVPKKSSCDLLNIKVGKNKVIKSYIWSEEFRIFGQFNHDPTPMLHTAKEMKFSIKDFFSKCDQVRRKLQIWSHLLNKSLKENFIFCAVPTTLLFFNLLSFF